MHFDSGQILGLIGIGLGAMAIVRRKIYFGRRDTPTYSVSGPPAVLLGVVVIVLGLFLFWTT